MPRTNFVLFYFLGNFGLVKWKHATTVKRIQNDNSKKKENANSNFVEVLLQISKLARPRQIQAKIFFSSLLVVFIFVLN